MKVAVWGAGDIGKNLVHRLVTTGFVSELHWINRNYELVESRVIDIEHGMCFSPICRRIQAARQESAREVLDEVDILVVTYGHAVEPGKTREDVYQENATMFDGELIHSLSGKDNLIVLVVTNPVDHLARHIYLKTGLHSDHVIGLGTVVDSARLSHCISSYISPRVHQREVWTYAVGFHNPDVVAVLPSMCAIGQDLLPGVRRRIAELARKEIGKGADRVKHNIGESSLQPVIEGIVHVMRAIALDTHTIATTSVLDPDSEDKLFYSVPCKLGSTGIVERMGYLIPKEEMMLLQESINKARKFLNCNH